MLLRLCTCGKTIFKKKENSETKFRFGVTWGKLAEHIGIISAIADEYNLKLKEDSQVVV